MHKKLELYLEANEIKYDRYDHPAVFTVEESKNIKNEIPGLHCKCLFLRDENYNYYLLGCPAQKRVDLKILRKNLQVKKLQFGSPEKLYEFLKLKPGSVSIFGMVNCTEGVKLLIAKEVWDSECVGFHPNDNTATLVIDHANLVKYYESLVCDKEVVDLE